MKKVANTENLFGFKLGKSYWGLGKAFVFLNNFQFYDCDFIPAQEIHLLMCI